MLFVDIYSNCKRQDEICKSIAENGGIDALLNCIDDSGAQGNKVAAKVCCSLLSKVGYKITDIELFSQIYLQKLETW